MNRYSRQLSMPEIGLEGQQKLNASKVLIIGAGGLGSPAALYLTAAGVGTLGIIDYDAVSESNLNRQILYTAITRTKYATYIVSDKENLEKAIKTTVERDTQLFL